MGKSIPYRQTTDYEGRSFSSDTRKLCSNPRTFSSALARAWGASSSNSRVKVTSGWEDETEAVISR